MKLLDLFISKIKSNNLFSPKDKLLIAVSGGVDSVVLCELCKQAGYDFSIAHCNFKLRGEESERDEQFVRKLGEKYGVEVLVKEFETEIYAAENKISIQEAARNLRYYWFSQLWIQKNMAPVETDAKPENSTPGWHVPDSRYFVLTAHHADDNSETLLMNFFRGTGLHGLTGIPETGAVGVFNFIKRPLLQFSKEELLAFANENNLDFAEDSSNQSSKYTRNFFRNELIPAISKVYPQVKENLQDNIRRFKEIEKLYQLSVAALKKKLCRHKESEIHIPVKQLMGYNNTALIYEIISPYGFNEKQVEEVVKLADSYSGKYIQSPTDNYRIIKHRHWFIISPIAAMASTNIIIENDDKKIRFESGELKIEISNNLKPSTLNNIVSLDIAAIQFPLLLRKWKTGDYFYPLGMKKKKKINRFLIDQKLSLADKENVWVVESNQRIAWVVGYRIDDRFKITKNTKSVLSLSLEK